MVFLEYDFMRFICDFFFFTFFNDFFFVKELLWKFLDDRLGVFRFFFFDFGLNCNFLAVCFIGSDLKIFFGGFVVNFVFRGEGGILEEFDLLLVDFGRDLLDRFSFLICIFL